MPFQQQLQPADDDQSIPGEWDEFDKVQPLDKRADEAKNSIDNPENADDDDINKNRNIVKKDIQMPLDGLSTQTFKVTFAALNLSLHPFLCFPKCFLFFLCTLYLTVESLKISSMLLYFKGPQNERQKRVVEAISHSWKGYKQFAFGHDNLKPISQSFSDWFGLGLTIIDSLDTLYIANMMEEYEEAKSWVESSLKLDVNRDVNLFETTIRVLGNFTFSYVE